MDLNRSLGICAKLDESRSVDFRRYINLKLKAMGLPIYKTKEDCDFLEIAHDLLEDYMERTRLLKDHLSPVDQRIQNFLDRYIGNDAPKLPFDTFLLDRHGLGRELSLPPDSNSFKSEWFESYRVHQGVLHNPKNDRRTTKGVFHIVAGGLPIPADKKEVPKVSFAKILKVALNPPENLLELPFTSTQNEKTCVWTSLMLRPLVSPKVPGKFPEKRMETRFFAPGSLVANLDFVESIFGNAGSPYLPENDAGLDPFHWTGHTGCVILATHLCSLKKKDVGLPHISKATERQKTDGMCYETDDELYNEGNPFKITCRDESGVIITIIADNYFGYCKKEVKTQIGYASNLFGLSEEEHAGGALAFASFNHGEQFFLDSHIRSYNQTLAVNTERFSETMLLHPEGYAEDKKYSNIIYLPEDARIIRDTQSIVWSCDGSMQELRLKPKTTYIYPNGYKIELQKHPKSPAWRLVGTVAEGIFCHKPCTVSGGGKSEISKSIADAILYGPIFIANFEHDIKLVQELFDKDYSDRLIIKADYSKQGSRPILCDQRTLGSVIKLMTPSPGEFTDEYNEWLTVIPDHIKALLFTIKRFYRPEWGNDWREHFSLDNVNGRTGHELKFNGRKLEACYLRIGQTEEGNWRTYKLRQDFMPARKLQMEDDITASIVIPSDWLENKNIDFTYPSVKLSENCEYRFFQRPDEAVIRGFDYQAEKDLAGKNVFISNFQPLDHHETKALVEDAVSFDKWTSAMQECIEEAAVKQDGNYAISSAHPRIVNGVPTKNPRYLQTRPELTDNREVYIAEIGARFLRCADFSQALSFPVNVVFPGRRNNPAEPGIRPLAVYNPIHYQELPELFMDFICSLTGKSPSTTGAGSEGALTKGPFNSLRSTADLNNALVSYIVTGYNGFTSAAGHIGDKRKIDHDISLLIPELWCHMDPEKYNPKYLIEERMLERVEDFEFEGNTILASRLGYRITNRFVHSFFGKIFDQADTVFDEAMLKPETQNIAFFADGVNNIVEAQQRVAMRYIKDGSIEDACPPLKAILYIMAEGTYNGKDLTNPAIREMFTRETMLSSDWYKARLLCKQQRDIALWQRHVDYIRKFTKRTSYKDVISDLDLKNLLKQAELELKEVQSFSFLDSLTGTIGADPLSSI